jgi:hypothetical protein
MANSPHGTSSSTVGGRSKGQSDAWGAANRDAETGGGGV